MLHPLSAPQKGGRVVSVPLDGTQALSPDFKGPRPLPLLSTFVSALSTYTQELGHMVEWGCHDESDLVCFQVAQFPKDQEKEELGVFLN